MRFKIKYRRDTGASPGTWRNRIKIRAKLEDDFDVDRLIDRLIPYSNKHKK